MSDFLCTRCGHEAAGVLCDDCLDVTEDLGETHAWGARPRPVRPRPPCGTRPGLDYHRRVGEPACEPCKAAKAAIERERRANNPSYAQRRRDYNRAWVNTKRNLTAEGVPEDEARRRASAAGRQAVVS